MDGFDNLFNKKNQKRKKIYRHQNITRNDKINLISQIQRIFFNKVPQIINNYDVKVNIMKEKSNNININNMNINSLYHKSDSFNDFINDNINSSHLFKNITLNKTFNKNEHLFKTKYSLKKINLNPQKISFNYLNNSKNKDKYEKIISKLKNEFKIIEKSFKKDNLSKTQVLTNKINFQKKEKLNDIKIKLLKSNNNKINKNKQKKSDNYNDMFLSTDLALLKRKNKKKTKCNNFKEKRVNSIKNKYSFDLTNFSFDIKKTKKYFKFKNFNDIYDNLISIKDIKLKTKNKSENLNKRIKLKIINAQDRNHDINSISIENKSFRTEKNKYNRLNSQNISKINRRYYKCTIFGNLNKLKFENSNSNKKKLIQINAKKNNIKIYKNISLSYYSTKLDKYSNYYKYKKNFMNDYNYDNMKGINILNEVINIQRNIIIRQIQKEEKLKNEIKFKMNEINKFKYACLKFLYFLRNEKSKYNKYIEIQRQLLKENIILKQIILSNKILLFKIEENKVHDLKLFFEKEKNYYDTNFKNKLILRKSKEKKDLIYKMLDKNKTTDYSLYKKKENSYEYKREITSDPRAKNNFQEIKNKIQKIGKKKLNYLFKNKK